MSILDVITGKERKIYNQVIQLMDQGNYSALFNMDRDFGLTNQKYIDRILGRMEQEASSNPDFIIQMNLSYYDRADHFNEVAIKSNPKIIERFIDRDILKRDILKSYRLIPMALENGYVPNNDYVNEHMRYFSSIEAMTKLFDEGYKPTNEIIARHEIEFKNLLSNPNLADRILDTIELTPEIINSYIFSGNAIAQQKVITKRPDLLLSLNTSSETYEQFWIEAFKQGYIPQEALDAYSVNSNFLLFSKVIKQRPEMVKYCRIFEKSEREQIDELALCMGYVPTISDAQNSKYIKRSPKLMQALILRRPEAIKYITENTIDVSQNEFCDLARLALDNGYIPTEKDIEGNPRLADSFDIMKILVQENPELINIIRTQTPNQEELLKIAIDNGFNGTIVERYRGTEAYNYLLFTETAIMYQLDRGNKFEDVFREIPSYNNNYSINLYNYLIDNGYQTKNIINWFAGNFETMKEIISKNPEYITIVSTELSREKIDELGLLAIQGGYEPKIEDEIFGYGSEIIKTIVEKYPNYLEKVHPNESFYRPAIPRDVWLEICKISTDAGFMPDVETMGNGYGGIEETNYSSIYEIMKKAIPLKPKLIESCDVADKEKYDELCRLAISCGYEITSEYVLKHRGK